MSPFDREPMTSYWCSIVTMALTIIQCRKILWPWNPSQEPIKVIESGAIRYSGYGFLLVFSSNFVPETHRFWDIWLQIYRDLANCVRGPSRSMKISPFDRAHMTSYWRSLVTVALSCVISEIFNVENFVTSKSRSRVSQGHWKWYNSIDWVWLPVNVL